MNIPGKNGVHSMEDILADIRREAADRKAGRMAAGGLALASASDEMASLGDEVEAGESDDLPTILRSRDAHPATSARLNVQPLRPTPGMRLVEALRRTEAAVHANDGHFHAANDAAVAEDGQPEATEPDIDSPALAAVPDALEHAPMKRVMVSFLDPRMSRMAALSGPAPEPVADEIGDPPPPFPTLSEIDEAALTGLVPSLILQPLVENSLKYAIAPREEGGRLRIIAQLEGPKLKLAVADDGPGLPIGVNLGEGRGVGFRNTRERLAALYGDHQTLAVRFARPGLRLEITLPFERAVQP